MKIVIETYRLLRRMGMDRAYSTPELVDITGKQRCAVLKRLHRLQEAGFIESQQGPDSTLYWRVINMPDKPKPPKRLVEPISIWEKIGLTDPDQNSNFDHKSTGSINDSS